jgi:hypothetical protein
MSSCIKIAGYLNGATETQCEPSRVVALRFNDGLFVELKQPRPVIGLCRRDLQRKYMSVLLSQLGADDDSAGEMQAAIRAGLNDLGARLNQAASRARDALDPMAPEKSEGIVGQRRLRRPRVLDSKTGKGPPGKEAPGGRTHTQDAQRPLAACVERSNPNKGEPARSTYVKRVCGRTTHRARPV